MPRYSVMLSVKYIKEELVFGPYSFADRDSGQNWITMLSKRMERLEQRWIWGTRKKWCLDHCSVLDEEEVFGSSPPRTLEVAERIENWYLIWSLAYNIERSDPKQNAPQ